MTTPEEYVQQKAAASGSSFYYAFLFLAPPRRAAITAFYAFCREVDDVADEVTDPGVAGAKLAWWRSEVGAAFSGNPSHPAMRALMPHIADYGIEPKHLLAVIDGCQMDLDQSRYLDFAGLARYCDLVAGVVGEVAANIFGRTLDSTVEKAALATANNTYWANEVEVQRLAATGWIALKEGKSDDALRLMRAAAQYLYEHGIPAYAYSTEIPVAVLGAKYQWARGAGLL